MYAIRSYYVIAKAILIYKEIVFSLRPDSLTWEGIVEDVKLFAPAIRRYDKELYVITSYSIHYTKLYDLHSNKSANIVGVCQEKIEYDSSLPICIEIHLTNKCNLLCEWCIDKHIRNNFV